MENTFVSIMVMVMSLYMRIYINTMSRKNQKVKRGDLIGFVGSTGRSEAPHLHYEIFKDGERINPINFYYGSLTAEEFNVTFRTFIFRKPIFRLNAY